MDDVRIEVLTAAEKRRLQGLVEAGVLDSVEHPDVDAVGLFEKICREDVERDIADAEAAARRHGPMEKLPRI